MRSKNWKNTRVYLILVLLGLAMIGIIPTIVTAGPLSSAQNLRAAWHYAADLGVYRYQTNVLQTVHPTTKLANVGRSSKTQSFSVSGQMDKPNDSMQMTMSSDGGSNVIDLKVEDGLAYGRFNPQAEWTEVEDQSDIFAPGGDPMGYLNAADNIEALEMNSEELKAIIDTDPILNSSLLILNSATRYTFDLDGPRYAQFMREQMEDELRRKGELPAGINLGLANVYVDMKGRGEIWVNDETGLPVHQKVHLEFPPEKGALNRVEANISTTFSGWEESARTQAQAAVIFERLKQNPTALFTDPGSLYHSSFTIYHLPFQTFAIISGLALLLIGLAALAIIYRNSPKLYAALSLSVIVSMLGTPLFQATQVSAFYERQNTRQLEHEQQTAQRENAEQLQTDISGRNFNPFQKPTFDRSTDQVVEAVAPPQSPPTPPLTPPIPATLTPTLTTTDSAITLNVTKPAPGLMTLTPITTTSMTA